MYRAVRRDRFVAQSCSDDSANHSGSPIDTDLENDDRVENTCFSTVLQSVHQEGS